MSEAVRIDVVTIFPGMLNGFLGESMMSRASEAGIVSFGSVNPREFTTDVHRTVDDRPYGGGPGMVMKPEPLSDAIESVKDADARVVLMCPQGRPFCQELAQELSEERHLVFVCGHYEGVDERVRQMLVTDEISIGDYVLTNGALAAAVVIDAVVRLMPGVLGCDGSVKSESFSDGVLEYPQYTRPAEFRGVGVPEILRSGDHGAIAQWRQAEALKRTRERRPDLLSKLKSNVNDSEIGD